MTRICSLPVLHFAEFLHALRQDTSLSTGTALARELLGSIFFAPLHRGSHFEALLEDAGASRGLRLALRREESTYLASALRNVLIIERSNTRVLVPEYFLLYKVELFTQRRQNTETPVGQRELKIHFAKWYSLQS